MALIAVGGLRTAESDTPPDAVAAAQSTLSATGAPGLKLSVLKYGSGGVAAALVGQQQINNYVRVRGTRALDDLAAQEASSGL